MSNAALQSDSSEPTYAELLASNARLEQDCRFYKFQIEQLKRYIYGRRSEKRLPESKEQVPLFGAGGAESPTQEEPYVEVAAHRKRKSSKKRIPEGLPVDEVVYAPHATRCAECGEELREFSRDVREELEFEPQRFFRRQHVTVHCSCPKCKATVSGEVPPENKPVIPGSEVGAGFLAQLMTSRICDHLPYYRQSQMYERLGVFLSDKTLSRYGLRCGELLEPVAKLIKQKLLQYGYLQADETRLAVLDAEQSPNTHTGQLWVLSNPFADATYYEYQESRGKEAASAFLAGFRGVLQTDGYVCYEEHAGIHLGCMAHARRYFDKAKELAPAECKRVLNMIGELYLVESDVRKVRPQLKPDTWHARRLKERQARSIDILERLRAYLVTLKDKWLLQEHPLYKAIHYTLNRFDALARFTTDGQFEIDNNHVERMIRPIAIGRRNWLFAGSHHGARMSAVLMTVINTAKQMKLNPYDYLKDVLPRLAQQSTTALDGLSPFDWKMA